MSKEKNLDKVLDKVLDKQKKVVKTTQVANTTKEVVEQVDKKLITEDGRELLL